MKKIMVALFAAMMAIGVVGCNEAEDNGKITQPSCDKSDPKCVELSTEG